MSNLPNMRALSLHIPEPKSRPGNTPDFSDIAVSAAGEVRRPAIDSDPASMADLSTALIRVLDEDGQACGPWNPHIGADMLVRALRAMVLTRAYDERMARMQRQGKSSFYMKCTGEEVVANK